MTCLHGGVVPSCHILSENATHTHLVRSSRRRYHQDMERKPLLLHCCCGPCSTSSIERLQSLGYEPVLFFGNSNIFPEQEAQRRYAALEDVARHFSLQLIRHAWDHQSWLQHIRGFEQEPERGRRCELCFSYNLREAAAESRRRGIALFTTTLTVSPHKSAPLIFSLATQWEDFLAIDFKKQNGFGRSIILSQELELYRQDYCGCEFSLRDRLRRSPDK